jgi:hypothetical protein
MLGRMTQLTLNRWYVDAGGPDPEANCRRLVNEIAVPVVSDSAVIEAIVSFYVSKHYRDPPTADAVWLTFVRQAGKGGALVDAIRPHLATVATLPPDLGKPDPICSPSAAEYRTAMEMVNHVALELHVGDLEKHRTLLRGLGEEKLDRAVLDAHLRKYSATYRNCCSTPSNTADFWRSFHQQGPTGLSKPGHWLWNIVAC